MKNLEWVNNKEDNDLPPRKNSADLIRNENGLDSSPVSSDSLEKEQTKESKTISSPDEPPVLQHRGDSEPPKAVGSPTLKKTKTLNIMKKNGTNELVDEKKQGSSPPSSSETSENKKVQKAVQNTQYDKMINDKVEAHRKSERRLDEMSERSGSVYISRGSAH